MNDENITSEFSHFPVMLAECVEGLSIKENGIYVDCTTGGGGHSLEIAKRLKPGYGRLICLDRDSDALRAAGERLAPYLDRVTFYKDNFENIANVLDALSVSHIDGALLDLGVSSYQLDEPSRGFSYNKEARLDMRMDVSSPLDAYEVVNTYTYERLRDIIFMYGEEGFAPAIAKAIVSKRESAPIETTTELSDIIVSAIPKRIAARGHHPAKKTFQAIRIEVNGELGAIAPAINGIVSRLNQGGRIVIITFHSLEDRIVKETYAKLIKGCVCPPSFPVCVCGIKPSLKAVTKKPVLPTESELEVNRRSHSAKLRIAEKVI